MSAFNQTAVAFWAHVRASAQKTHSFGRQSQYRTVPEVKSFKVWRSQVVTNACNRKKGRSPVGFSARTGTVPWEDKFFFAELQRGGKRRDPSSEEQKKYL
jgi:hypothetical protein